MLWLFHNFQTRTEKSPRIFKMFNGICLYREKTEYFNLMASLVSLSGNLIKSYILIIAYLDFRFFLFPPYYNISANKNHKITYSIFIRRSKVRLSHRNSQTKTAFATNNRRRFSMHIFNQLHCPRPQRAAMRHYGFQGQPLWQGCRAAPLRP